MWTAGRCSQPRAHPYVRPVVLGVRPDQEHGDVRVVDVQLIAGGAGRRELAILAGPGRGCGEGGRALGSELCGGRLAGSAAR